jgi:hypothetical protein
MDARIYLLLGSAGLMVLLAMPASAETGKPPPDRATNIIVYGNDPCPKGEGDEIVVCARRPEEERYRIPKELRNTEKDTEARPWPDRAQALEDAARYALPGYCSTVGPSSQASCWVDMIRRWQAERRDMKAQENIAR